MFSPNIKDTGIEKRLALQLQTLVDKACEFRTKFPGSSNEHIAFIAENYTIERFLHFWSESQATGSSFSVYSLNNMLLGCERQLLKMASGSDEITRDEFWINFQVLDFLRTLKTTHKELSSSEMNGLNIKNNLITEIQVVDAILIVNYLIKNHKLHQYQAIWKGLKKLWASTERKMGNARFEEGSQARAYFKDAQARMTQ
ncbi:hypothetical protein O181_046075 [Austropuccinia psidii MF-1]|uniref:Uncharacterized protein n=1 Tax=Austropuccinia psidii MF-1 TaxID=1389203 RepID=A0A9Q3DSM3_9BASI|nr:hypothetical protein [Austropuccinia psidii MF-1]